MKLICLYGESVTIPTCYHPNMTWVFFFADYFTALWYKSDHLHTTLLLIKEQPAECYWGGGEPLSQRNMAAPAALNDATAAPSR